MVMYLRFIIYSLIAIVFIILGIFGGYHLARYWGIGKGIYGNDVDGFDGDANWKNKEAKYWYIRLWPDFWWSAIRNPVHNLLLNHFSAKGILTEWYKLGCTTYAVIGGKTYFFYHCPVTWKDDPMKFGWKLWDSEMVVGKRVKRELVFNP